jgi:hypothetical protein
VFAQSIESFTVSAKKPSRIGSSMRIAVVLLVAPAFFSGMAQAQTACSSQLHSIGGPLSDLDRTFQLAKQTPLNSQGITRTGWSVVQNCSALTGRADTASGFARSLLPVAVVVQNNSGYPRTQLDGLRWGGRGVSASASAGFALRWGKVTAAVAPVGSYQMNEDFPFLLIPAPALSRYGNYFHAGAIDWPQRFGTGASFWAHPGQSFVRADAFGWAAGFSTENMRWGPARQNPILMSIAGPGFPHFFVGTSRPLKARIVDLGLELIWGRLAESNHFDTLTVNDRRMFAGVVGTVSPMNSGLTLGFARAYVRTLPPVGFSLNDEILGPYINLGDNPADPAQGDNQLISVFLMWTLPDAGFEGYGEYAREDHWENVKDLFLQLDHSRGYTIGFEKVFSLQRPKHIVRVAGEATNLANSSTPRSGRSGGTFYVHNQVRQGYTHRGQLLGAPIGPGSDAQYISVDYVGTKLMGGAYYSRARYDNDTYYQNFAWRFSNAGHDTEWTLGARGGRAMDNVHITFDLAFSKRYNRGFVDLVNIERVLYDTNLSMTLAGAWVPGARKD